VNTRCQKRLKRLLTIVGLHEEQTEALAQIRKMREWVLEVEHLFAGSWAQTPAELTNAEVDRRLTAYVTRLSQFVEDEQRTEDEKLR
jgi:hypothetical protein